MPRTGNNFVTRLAARARARARAFTLLELTIGLVVMAMVLGAVSAFSLSVSRAWENSDALQSSSLTCSQVTMRLLNELRTVQGFGAVIAGTATPNTSRAAVAPAAVLLWKRDGTSNNNYTDADGKIEYSELELIEYEPSADKTTGRSLYTWTATPLIDLQMSRTVFNDPATIAEFKKIATRRRLASNLDGAKFYVLNGTSTVQRPIFEFALSFVRDQAVVTTQYGAVSLRVPATQPSN
jgi:type II secretory pathway pseudopilin PulG